IRHVGNPTNGAAGWLAMVDGTWLDMVNLWCRTALWRQATLSWDTSLDMTSAAAVAFGRARSMPSREALWPTTEASGSSVHRSRLMRGRLALACYTALGCPNDIMSGKAV